MKILEGTYRQVADLSSGDHLFTIECHGNLRKHPYPLDIRDEGMIGDWWICEAEEIVAAYWIHHPADLYQPEDSWCYAFAAAWERSEWKTMTEESALGKLLDGIAAEGGAAAYGPTDPNASDCSVGYGVDGVAVLGWGYTRLGLLRQIARADYIEDRKNDWGKIEIKSVAEVRVRLTAVGGFIQTDDADGIPMTFVEIGEQ